jgi:hypothetical protein
MPAASAMTAGLVMLLIAEPIDAVGITSTMLVSLGALSAVLYLRARDGDRTDTQVSLTTVAMTLSFAAALLTAPLAIFAGSTWWLAVALFLALGSSLALLARQGLLHADQRGGGRRTR